LLPLTQPRGREEQQAAITGALHGAGKIGEAERGAGAGKSAEAEKGGGAGKIGEAERGAGAGKSEEAERCGGAGKYGASAVLLLLPLRFY
jgi:hypothetical protein